MAAVLSRSGKLIVFSCIQSFFTKKCTVSHFFKKVLFSRNKNTAFLLCFLFAHQILRIRCPIPLLKWDIHVFCPKVGWTLSKCRYLLFWKKSKNLIRNYFMILFIKWFCLTFLCCIVFEEFCLHFLAVLVVTVSCT